MDKFYLNPTLYYSDPVQFKFSYDLNISFENKTLYCYNLKSILY